MTQNIVTVFGIPFSSIMKVFGWTLVVPNCPVVRDRSLLYSFFTLASDVVLNVVQSGGLSISTYLIIVKVGISCSRGSWSSM